MDDRITRVALFYYKLLDHDSEKEKPAPKMEAKQGLSAGIVPFQYPSLRLTGSNWNDQLFSSFSNFKSQPDL